MSVVRLARPTVLVSVIAAATLLGGDPRAGATPRHVPDLRVADVVFGWEVYIGSHIGIRVENQGTATARGATVTLFASRDRKLSRDDRALRHALHIEKPIRPGQPSPPNGYWVVYPEGARRGLYVLACVDHEHRVRESNEDNNCRSSRHRVKRLV